MSDATRLVGSIRSDLAEIEQEIRSHPYLEAVENGAVEREALKAFPGHQYHIVTSDLRSIATLVHRFGDRPARAFFAGVLQGELAAVDSITELGRGLGMSEEELRNYEVQPEGFAYATFMAWQALYNSAAEVACGFLVNFEAWGSNCGRLSAALRDRYGLTEKDTAFLDSFANMPSFEETALEIIQDGLDHGAEPGLIHRAARMFQGYELMFWNAMAAAAPSNDMLEGRQ